ncbi:hypothetical protein BCR34DRAFT_570191 [Clohesyomyces aquaticus]|uniref:Uncharacterized protein n=1 Tax=Clohesyomyces aquaticus TaxID=1231657 RepID=A0A1Y1ZCQ9_9PLEO|nr:hypothetical protein BCR34DRAFT_570191 [Clohesyomyces aquaticus]
MDCLATVFRPSLLRPRIRDRIRPHSCPCPCPCPCPSLHQAGFQNFFPRACPRTRNDEIISSQSISSRLADPPHAMSSIPDTSPPAGTVPRHSNRFKPVHTYGPVRTNHAPADIWPSHLSMRAMSVSCLVSQAVRQSAWSTLYGIHRTISQIIVWSGLTDVQTPASLALNRKASSDWPRNPRYEVG